MSEPVHPQPLGITCRYDRDRGRMMLAATGGKPNLAALPVLLLWLYPDKLPLAWSMQMDGHPGEAVWTIVSLDRIEVLVDPARVRARLAALRAAPRGARRFDLHPRRGPGDKPD